MKGCSAMRQVSKIIILFCMLLLPHSTDTRFQMSTQDQYVMTSLNSDVLLPCIFRTQGDFVDTESIIVTWTHNNKEIARYKAGDVLNTSKALLFESELQKGNASLLLRNFQVEDKGEYICHVVDAPDEGQITVRLEDIADQTLSITPSFVSMEQPNQLECNAVGFHSEITSIDCSINQKTLETLENLVLGKKSDGTFFAKKKFMYTPTEDDIGANISCFVTQQSQKSLETIFNIPIKFLELPKVMIVPDILVRGKDQIISCIIDEHFPEEIRITWKKNGVPLRKTEMKDYGTFITSESLILNPVDENDEFTCEVKVMNKTIRTTKKFKLTGNSLSLAGIGNIVLSIILILILILIALCIWYVRANCSVIVMHRDELPAPGELIVKLGECLTLKVMHRVDRPELSNQNEKGGECLMLNDV